VESLSACRRNILPPFSGPKANPRNFLADSLLAISLICSSTLKMEIAYLSETLENFCQTARHNITENSSLPTFFYCLYYSSTKENFYKRDPSFSTEKKLG
jgi:hypothetical protein